MGSCKGWQMDAIFNSWVQLKAPNANPEDFTQEVTYLSNYVGSGILKAYLGSGHGSVIMSDLPSYQ